MSQKRKARRNRLAYSEVQDETRSGSQVAGKTANKFLQVISLQFAGGRAFTAKELATEAGTSESNARAAIKLLRRKGYVHERGRELTNQGKPGPMSFVGTLVAEERAQSARDVSNEREGEALAEAEIAQREALADFLGVQRAKPGQGETYRPLIRRLQTKGHKLPKLTTKRIRGAGYRVCVNPLDAQEVRRGVTLARRLAKKGAQKEARAVVALLVMFGRVAAVHKNKRRLGAVLRAVRENPMPKKKRPKKTSAKKAKKGKKKNPAHMLGVTALLNPLTKKESRDQLRYAIQTAKSARDASKRGMSKKQRQLREARATGAAQAVVDFGPPSMRKRAAKLVRLLFKRAGFGRLRTNPQDEEMRKAEKLAKTGDEDAIERYGRLAVRYGDLDAFQEAVELAAKIKDGVVMMKLINLYDPANQKWTSYGKDHKRPKTNPEGTPSRKSMIAAIRSLQKNLKRVPHVLKTAEGIRHPYRDLQAAIGFLKKQLHATYGQKPHGKKNPLTKKETRELLRQATGLARTARTAWMSETERAAAYGFAAGLARAVAHAGPERSKKEREAGKRGRRAKAASLSSRLHKRGAKGSAKGFQGTGTRQKTNPLKARDIAFVLIGQHGQREAFRIADQKVRHARVHNERGELAKWERILHQLARIARKLRTKPKTNPKGKKKRPKKRKGSKRSSRKPAKSVKRIKRYGDLPAALKKKYASAARKAAHRDRIPLADVPIEWAKSDRAHPHGLVNQGDLHAIEYRFHRKGSKSRFEDARYRHAAGDHGKGKKKTKPQAVGVDPTTRQVHLVSRRGSRPGFSTERGLTG